MNRQLKVIGGIVVTLAIVAAGVFFYMYATGGSGTPTAALSAPTLESTTAAQKVFRIDPNQSEVRFTLDEKLMGNPTTVVGKTNQIAGDILIDPSSPGKSTIGEIRINARSLATDNDMRNRMIRSQILQSSQDKFEFIGFVPKSITGLPDKVTPGQPVNLKITGDLTIRDVTKSVTFDTTVTLVSDSTEHLQGSASTTVNRADFNLEIPKVPSVADVTEEVKLDIDFKAVLANSAATGQ
jgi:polyisoprenoid-binding protein YceI